MAEVKQEKKKKKGPNETLLDKKVTKMKKDKFFKEYKKDDFPFLKLYDAEYFYCKKIGTDLPYIVKIVDSHYPHKNKLYDEISLLKELYHPNLSNILHAYGTETGYYIVYSYFKFVPILDYFIEKTTGMKKFEFYNLLLQIIKVYAYLHNNNLVHGSTSLNYIAYNNGIVTIFNYFNVTKLAKNENTNELIGEPYFRGPELIDNKTGQPRKNAAYTQKSEVFAIGACIYGLITGEVLINKKLQNIADPSTKVNKKLSKKTIPQRVIDTLVQMTVGDVSSRTTLEYILKSPDFLFGSTPAENKKVLYKSALSLIFKYKLLNPLERVIKYALVKKKKTVYDCVQAINYFNMFDLDYKHKVTFSNFDKINEVFKIYSYEEFAIQKEQFKQISKKVFNIFDFYMVFCQFDNYVIENKDTQQVSIDPKALKAITEDITDNTTQLITKKKIEKVLVEMETPIEAIDEDAKIDYLNMKDAIEISELEKKAILFLKA